MHRLDGHQHKNTGEQVAPESKKAQSLSNYEANMDEWHTRPRTRQGFSWFESPEPSGTERMLVESWVMACPARHPFMECWLHEFEDAITRGQEVYCKH